MNHAERLFNKNKGTSTTEMKESMSEGRSSRSSSSFTQSFF